MGLWDWIISTLTSGGSADSCGAERAGCNSAVGLLEPPDFEQLGEPARPDTPCWWAPPDATLTQLAVVPRPDLPTEALAFENLLASHLDGHDLRIPPIPRTPERVLRQLVDSRSSLASVATTISGDAVMAGAILRMANSPLYRGLDKITSVETAVARLGAQAIRVLMLSESVRSTTFSRKGRDDSFARTIWRRSLATASIMRELGPLVRLDPDECFLVGLLHDVGNVIVLRLMHQHESLIGTAINPETFEYFCFECHQEFGELLADEWSLPAGLRNLIANHHGSPPPDHAQRCEWLLIQVADMIASLLGFAPEYAYDLLRSAPIHGLGLDQSTDLIEVLKALPDRIDETVAAL